MRVPRSVLLGLIITAFAAPLSAQTTLGFEGLSTEFVPQGYGGFSWVGGFGENSWVLSSPDFFGNTDLHRPSSGVVNAWSNGGTTLDMITASASLFDFNSVYLSAANG